VLTKLRYDENSGATNMRVIIIGNAIGFPIGLAATSRVRCFAKGLLAAGCSVEVLNTVGLHRDYSEGQAAYKGIAEEVHYRFCGGFSIRPNAKIFRLMEKILGENIAGAILIYRKLSRKLDCVIAYSRSDKFIRKYGHLCHLLRVPFVVELCEWPEAIAETKCQISNHASAFTKNVARYASAVIPISRYIEKEMRCHADGRDLPSLIMPVLFDHEPSHEVGESNKYILYTGSADYIDIWTVVIDVIAMLVKMGVKAKLILTGTGRKNAVDQLKTYIVQKGVDSVVEYRGYVDDTEFYRLVGNATLHLAPLPNNTQSIARFPTKLAFYLASGKPVVTSNVGEVEYFLQDGKTAYIVSEQCLVADFAAKVKYVLDYPVEAGQVGLAGKELAFREFYYECQGRKLHAFLNKVVNSCNHALQ
jgi:glycosyltransferase involved in cell wall biosynthesis